MASINGQHLDPKPIAAQIKGLLNRNLTAILKAEGLPAHGLKAAMQARLIRSKHPNHTFPTDGLGCFPQSMTLLNMLLLTIV